MLGGVFLHNPSKNLLFKINQMALYPDHIIVGDVKYVPEENFGKTFKGIKKSKNNINQIRNELPRLIEESIFEDGHMNEVFVRLDSADGDQWLITSLRNVNKT